MVSKIFDILLISASVFGVVTLAALITIQIFGPDSSTAVRVFTREHYATNRDVEYVLIYDSVYSRQYQNRLQGDPVNVQWHKIPVESALRELSH